MVLKYLSQQKASDTIIREEENKTIKGQENLEEIEIEALEVCKRYQQLTKNVVGINLTNDIRENSKHLVILYRMKRTMETLEKLLPRHEVKDQRTGKVFGKLYDNENVGNVMLSTNISINSAIHHTEWHLRKISCRKLIL